MKKFIKSLNLSLSDLLLFVGFIAFAIFLIFGQLFMQFQDPKEVALPLWAAIICSVVMIGSWGGYLYIELYLKKNKFNPIIAITFLALIMLNIIAIVVQPEQSSEIVTIRYRADESLQYLIGTKDTALLSVSPTHKFVFISEMIGTGTFIYIAFFIFSKRITGVKFIEYLGYALFAFLGVLIIYSYISEWYKYAGAFKYLFGDHTTPITDILTVQSFIIHRNAFGMCMMLGIIFCFINHSIKPRKWLYPLCGYFYLSMVFSLCKTALLISALLIVIYFVYRLIVTYKEHQKRNKISFIVLGAVLVLGFIFIGVPYLTKGKILGKVYEAISTIAVGGHSLDARTYIWDNSFQLLQNGWWLIGRGFGTINLQLWPMNVISHEENYIPTHSGWVNLVAEGGIIFLLAYIAFLIYFGYITVKSYKKSPGFVFTVLLGVIGFFLYTFIETIEYLMYVFMFLIFVIYFSKEKEEAVVPQEAIEEKTE